MDIKFHFNNSQYVLIQTQLCFWKQIKNTITYSIQSFFDIKIPSILSWLTVSYI